MSHKTFENEVEEKYEKGEKEERLKISMLKYFWQASPLSVNRTSSIHHFLTHIDMFKQFSDYEIWTLTKYMHMRNFSSREIIFKEGDSGLGFYIIFSGRIEIFSNKSEEKDESGLTERMTKIAHLNKYDYLGELSIIDISRRRNATAMAMDSVSLLAMYKPDLDELIDNHPVVAAKFLQSIAIIISKRFYSVTSELRVAKEKIETLERTNATNPA